MQSRHCITIALTVLLWILPGCGGSSPPLRVKEDYAGIPAYDHSYYPYVSGVSVIGELTPGEVIEILFTIVPPEQPREHLFVEDTLSSPKGDWIEGGVFLQTRLRLSTSDYNEPGSGCYRYLGWSYIRHTVVVPSPGDYLVRYWSAVSLQSAGVYRDMDALRNEALVVRELPLTVPDGGAGS